MVYRRRTAAAARATYRSRYRRLCRWKNRYRILIFVFTGGKCVCGVEGPSAAAAGCLSTTHNNIYLLRTVKHARTFIFGL